MVVSGQVDPKQTVKAVVTCPCIIAVAAGLIIYLARIPLPEVLTSPISAIGDMNTPLSMIITGATIASSDLKKLLKNKNLFLTWGVRMLGVPAVELLIFALLGLHGTVPTIECCCWKPAPAPPSPRCLPSSDEVPPVQWYFPPSPVF